MANVIDCQNCDWLENCDLDPLTDEDDLIKCVNIQKEMNKKDKW